LANITNLAAVRTKIQGSNGFAIDGDIAILWVVEALNHLDDCGFSRARWTHQGSCFTSLNMQIKVLKDLQIGPSRIIEINSLENKITLKINFFSLKSYINIWLIVNDME
jgi:hypothetical protein